ncbi:MAG: helix-turn-helix transcriptional regulator [Candidatus Marinimicrobia bacterium]|nr:helix-turn-helix transcriptional regulator [Candidatus Neomarinimicrobiota bacterium]
MNTIFTIGIFLSFFLSLLLVAKKQKSLPDIILALWLSVIGIHLTSYYLYSLDFWSKYPHLIGTTLPIPLLHGPMLFLYTLYSLRNETRLRKIDYWHFLPAILSWLYMCRFYFFYSPEKKIMVDKGLIDDFSIFTNISLVAFILSGLTYPVLAFRMIGKHEQMIDDNFSFDDQLSLNWLKYCIYGTALLFLTAGILSGLKEGLGIQMPFNDDYILYILLVFFVLLIGYFGIRHQNIFIEEKSKNDLELVLPKSKGEYKKSGLKQEVAASAHQKLQQVMLENKPYTNPKLTLAELAELIDVSPNHLSQIINQYEQMNFHDFVNKYRIEEFIQKALSNKNYSLLAHALDAGFNSKSAFNHVFKKLKGVTPSKYLSDLST